MFQSSFVAGQQHLDVIEMRRTMYLGLGVVLLLLWIGGFLVFHISAFFIHILLILAVISMVFHFLRGSTSAA